MIVSPEGSSTTEKLPEHNEKKKKAKDKTINHGFDTVYSNETETLQIVKKHKPKKLGKIAEKRIEGFDSVLNSQLSQFMNYLDAQ